MSQAKILTRHFLINKEIGSLIIATEYHEKGGVYFLEANSNDKKIEEDFRADQTCKDNMYLWNGWKRIKEVN